jgi:hypothetical protein
MMDTNWYVGPPVHSPPHHCRFVVHRLPRVHFQQYISTRFGPAFWMEVAQSRVPVVLPIVTYGATWIMAVYILE